MTGQRFCERCGAALAPQLRFCERCGARVRAGPPPAATDPGPERPSASPAAIVHSPEVPGASVRAAAVAGSARKAGSAPAILAASVLLIAGLGAGWWLLRPSPPPVPGAGLDLAPSVYDDLPAKLSPTPPLPAEAPPLPDDPLARAREQRERAYERYTRMAVGEIDGDIDAARREFQDADAALKALESR